MTSRRKPHPADIAQAETVANAIRFDVALFVNGKFETASAKTLAEAQVEASLLSFRHPENTRRPMIYAIDDRGRSGLVTPTILDIVDNMKEQATMATKAKKAAKPKAAKTTKAPKAPTAEANGAPKPLGKRAQIEADARAGKMPKAPDFSAPTHERFRAKLAEVVALAKDADLKGLRAYKINPSSTSPKAIARYRDLAILALEAK